MQIRLSINHPSADKSPSALTPFTPQDCMQQWWMGRGDQGAARELEKTCYRFLFSSLLSPAVAGVVTGAQLYHLTIIHFLPAVTHLTPCLDSLYLISRLITYVQDHLLYQVKLKKLSLRRPDLYQRFNVPCY